MDYVLVLTTDYDINDQLQLRARPIILILATIESNPGGFSPLPVLSLSLLLQSTLSIYKKRKHRAIDVSQDEDR